MLGLLLKVEPTYGGFILIAWTGIVLGILHSLMPCEDKAIFCFYAFGVARDWKQAFRIVNFYGAGFMIMNLIMGVIITYFGSIIGPYFTENFGPYIINGLGAISLIISGIIMLYQIKKNRYLPHSTQLQDLTEGLGLLRKRKRTAFLLGGLAAIPPCIFELFVYFQGITFAITYGWGNGVWVFFFFGLGTWLGLIPLAIMGTMSGKLSKFMKNSSFRRITEKVRTKRKKTSTKEDIRVENSDIMVENIEEKSKLSSNSPIEEEKKPKRIYSKIEVWSAIILIIIGITFLILAILEVDLFLIEIPEVPDVPEIPEASLGDIYNGIA